MLFPSHAGYAFRGSLCVIKNANICNFNCYSLINPESVCSTERLMTYTMHVRGNFANWQSGTRKEFVFRVKLFIRRRAGGLRKQTPRTVFPCVWRSWMGKIMATMYYSRPRDAVQCRQSATDNVRRGFEQLYGARACRIFYSSSLRLTRKNPVGKTLSRILAERSHEDDYTRRYKTGSSADRMDRLFHGMCRPLRGVRKKSQPAATKLWC